MPAAPSSLLDPVREQFLALVDLAQPAGIDTHPLGRGHLPLAGDYERMIGLDLNDIAIDGCISRAPRGGEVARPSPVDRGTGGLKRSQLCEGAGMSMATVPALADRRDHSLLPATLDTLKDVEPLPEIITVHLGASYDEAPWRAELSQRGLLWSISTRGTPLQVGKRWVVEATNSAMFDFGKLRRCTERSAITVQAYLDLAAAIITIRALIGRARTCYRWDTRPRTPRIR